MEGSVGDCDSSGRIATGRPAGAPGADGASGIHATSRSHSVSSSAVQSRRPLSLHQGCQHGASAACSSSRGSPPAAATGGCSSRRWPPGPVGHRTGLPWSCRLAPAEAGGAAPGARSAGAAPRTFAAVVSATHLKLHRRLGLPNRAGRKLNKARPASYSTPPCSSTLAVTSPAYLACRSPSSFPRDSALPPCSLAGIEHVLSMPP